MRKVVPIVLALTLLGCATTKYPPSSIKDPPPSIKDGYYLNSKYQFSVKVPEGWQVSHEIPDRLKKILVRYKKETIPVVFYNRRTRGLIYIYVRTMRRYPYLWIQYEEVRHSLMSSLLETQKAMKSNPSVLDYSFEYGPECEFSETLLFEHPDSLDLYKTINTYRCYHDKDHFYFAILNLESWSYTFDKNHEVFEEFIEHFKTSNFMYGKDEAEK